MNDRQATHLGFLGDRTARCGSRSLLKSPDAQKVTCRACVRVLAGEPSLAQLLAAALVQWKDRITPECALVAVSGKTPLVFVRLAQELEAYYANDIHVGDEPLVLIESIPERSGRRRELAPCVRP